MEITKFASDLPYPTIEVKANLAQSKLLMPSYSGSNGELTAILTYCFQSYISPKYPDLEPKCTTIICLARQYIGSEAIP